MWATEITHACLSVRPSVCRRLLFLFIIILGVMTARRTAEVITIGAGVTSLNMTSQMPAVLAWTALLAHLSSSSLQLYRQEIQKIPLRSRVVFPQWCREVSQRQHSTLIRYPSGRTWLPSTNTNAYLCPKTQNVTKFASA